ncbi:hypothetical protein GCK72_022638 [Caenorhabditis remanei]|uniref:Uncharacterized protein n=1 Tax=Caenorhabditis remanei TaxID=31234 RepID=A0A6A5FUK1_CAERE|nr:hypothetical protein GCK72_022638 [Caenorhabditis remanei]KAF1746185.1 hypothetical protein GCK72_022638 [Caenorhabditis remanei]
MFSKVILFIHMISLILPLASSAPDYKCGKTLADLIFRVRHESRSNGVDIIQQCYDGEAINDLTVIQLCCPDQISI